MVIKNDRLLLIITDYGSFNNFLAELVHKIVDGENLEVHVICSNRKIIDINSKYTFDGKYITFHFLDIPRSFNIIDQISCSWRINQLIKAIDARVIHIHFTTAIFTTLLLSSGRKNNVFIGTFHGLNSVVSVGLKRFAYKLIESFCFAKLDQVFVLNSPDFSSVSRLYRRKTHLLKSKGLGCDLDLFDSSRCSSSKIKELKSRFNITDQFVIGFIGRFVDFKGFDIAIRTFLKLLTRHENKIKLMLIGGFDSAHKSGLSKHEKELIIQHEDIIDIGFIDDVYNYLPMMDLLLFPSRKEGLPIVVTESLAMGVPIVSFNSRGTNELLVNNFNGILIEANGNKKDQVDYFSETISTLMNDLGRLSYLKNNALLDRHHLSRSNFVDNEIEIYDKYYSKGSV